MAEPLYTGQEEVPFAVSVAMSESSSGTPYARSPGQWFSTRVIAHISSNSRFEA